MIGTMSKLTGMAMAVLLVFGSSQGRADVIRQGAGTEYLVVEGEAYEFLEGGAETEGFLIVTEEDPLETAFGSLVLPEDTNASGGAALYDQPGGGNFTNTATWQLQFATAGMYTLYYHYSMFEDQNPDAYGNEDSFFLPLDFNELPEQFGRSNLGKQGNDDPMGDPPYWEGHFHWQKATLEDGSPAEYQVRDGDVGMVLDFSMATRERGSTLDLMVFSLDPDLDFLLEEELDEMFLGAPGASALQAGDADQDFDFDQLDLVKVQVAAKYLSGQPATWGEGDWDGAPGGAPGNPPAGNGLFDQLDIIAALANGLYLAGPYAAIAPGGVPGDGQTSILYDGNTGELGVDAPAGTELTSINIDSAAGIFTGEPAQNLGGSFDNDADDNIFKATFGSSFGSLSFGNVAQPGLSEAFLLNDLTVVGSLAGGGDLGPVDLIWVPEPSAVVLLALAMAGLLLRPRPTRVPV